MGHDELLTREAAAELLGCSPRTVDRLIKSRQLRAAKINGLRRISRSAIDDLAAAMSVDTDDDVFVKALLAQAPPLTPEQRTKLAELLKPVRVSGGGPDG